MLGCSELLLLLTAAPQQRQGLGLALMLQRRMQLQCNESPASLVSCPSSGAS